MLYVRILGFVTLLLRLVIATVPAASAPLPADQAFQLRAQLDEEEGIELSWTIAPGYYLYRDRIVVTLDGQRIRTASEKGEPKDDPNFGMVEVYHGTGMATVPAELLPEKGRLVVTYQGCGENTICYPPISKTVDLATLLVEEAALGGAVAPTENRTASAAAGETQSGVSTAVSNWAAPQATGTATEAGLFGGGLASTVLAFLGFGLLLSFTPCIFPMIPILSGMLTRAGAQLSLARSFVLSASYVVAMAAAYGMLGIVVAWSGENLQAVLQTPWAVLAMSGVFIALALSMFGLYELQLPQSWTAKLAMTAGNKGSVGGAALLGFGSALIVGPCVTPPLAAAMVFVAQTGEVARGSLALFSLGLGMGLPLIGFGVLGTKVLPRSGAWLVRVKHIFGFVFVALAIWMGSRVFPVALTAIAWGAMFIAVGLYLDVPSLLEAPRWRSSSLARGAAGVLALFYGCVLVIGAALSDYGPLQPLVSAGLVASTTDARSSDGFQVVSTEPDLDRAIELGRQQGRSIMVDFSADWCTECLLMERNIFAQDVVRQQLRGMLLIRADLTHFDTSSRKLMQRFAVVGPPTVVFLNPDGSEITEARVVGDIGVDGFLGRLAKASRA
ncbi:MAG: protein-disulfide reductase DsbD [Xanthobacteraceae bacterium]|nr:protein-disulfide reductase DsbD [Xanthobacteraceae bacterium]